MPDREPLELWLVRHGETARSRDGRIAGWVDTPLTSRGDTEARAMRSLLGGQRFVSVWSSDLRRAVRTARLAWGEPRRDRRLRELHFGALEGQRWTSLDHRLQEGLKRFSGFAAPGGESLSDLRHRVFAFLDGLAGRHLLFTHGGVVRLLAREAGHDDFPPTGTVVAMDWTRRTLLFVRRPDHA